LVRLIAGLLLHGQDTWVVAFGVIEIAIGLGLMFKRTVKVALVASFVWAGAIWIIGEGLGGVFTSQASPLMGAPGASYLYAVVGALVWPVETENPNDAGVASSAIGSGRWGIAGGLSVWAALWFVEAILWLLPTNRAANSVQTQLTSMSSGEPAWYSHFLSSVGSAFDGIGLTVAVVLAVLSVVVALGPLVTRRPEVFLWTGMAIGLLYWASGEAFGQLLSFGGTDPSNGPPLLLLGLGLLPTVRAEAKARVPASYLLSHHRALTRVGTAAIALVPALVALVPASASSAVAATAPTPPTTARQEAGMTAGLPLQTPPYLNTATLPVMRLRLVAEPTVFDISGKTVRGESYDGDYVGPTMHFVPGEQVYITLVNKLSTPTNLHFHGLHVSPSGNSDNPFISVAPGQTFTYHLDIPMDQPLGTFWYHDHDMCMGDESMHMDGTGTSSSSDGTCSDIESQIYDGLSGTIIIGNDRTLLPPDLRNITAQTLVFKDMQITASHHIVQNSGTTSINSDNPTVRLVNGQLQPVLTMQPGQTELWRLANEGADIFYDLQLIGYKFTVVGQDGYPVAQVTTVNTLELPPAKRWDVLVTASTDPGTTWLRTLAINNGPAGDTYPNVKLMELDVSGAPKELKPMPTGAIPGGPPSLANADIAQYRTLKLSENTAGTKMYINHKEFNPNQSIFSTPATLGTVEQWTILNESPEIHAFHVHTDHFQVMSVNGVAQPYTGELDTFDVPYEQNATPGEIVIRIDFTDFTGMVMFHCHIASHEDAGMMSFINVVAPDT
jgi:FtsP/CotA-like multicopper oxidase with cupredoxin domain